MASESARVDRSIHISDYFFTTDELVKRVSNGGSTMLAVATLGELIADHEEIGKLKEERDKLAREFKQLDETARFIKRSADEHKDFAERMGAVNLKLNEELRLVKEGMADRNELFSALDRVARERDKLRKELDAAQKVAKERTLDTESAVAEYDRLDRELEARASHINSLTLEREKLRAELAMERATRMGVIENAAGTLKPADPLAFTVGTATGRASSVRIETVGHVITITPKD